MVIIFGYSLNRRQNEIIYMLGKGKGMALVPSVARLVSFKADGAPPSLCQCSVLQVFKAMATRIWGKSKELLKSPIIEPVTSCSESRTLTNWATPPPPLLDKNKFYQFKEAILLLPFVSTLFLCIFVHTRVGLFWVYWSFGNLGLIFYLNSISQS